MFSKLAVLAIAAVLPAAFAQLPPDCDRTYTVQPGDTCDSISQNNDVSSFQLTFVNTGINSACSNLFVGALLCLGRTNQDCTVNHEVVTGDFCSAIATDAGTTVATLLANNPNVDAACDNLRLGEVLCTANAVIPYNSTVP